MWSVTETSGMLFHFGDFKTKTDKCTLLRMHLQYHDSHVLRHHVYHNNRHGWTEIREKMWCLLVWVSIVGGWQVEWAQYFSSSCSKSIDSHMTRLLAELAAGGRLWLNQPVFYVEIHWEHNVTLQYRHAALLFSLHRCVPLILCKNNYDFSHNCE